jgi:hypothetical protein
MPTPNYALNASKAPLAAGLHSNAAVRTHTRAHTYRT